MQQEGHEAPIKTLQDIRSIMEKSARFISLSGWSGIWAGVVALAGSFIAKNWLKDLPAADLYDDAVALKFIILAVIVFIVALIGGYYFTLRKTRLQGNTIWNSASRRMVSQMAIPL